MTKMVESMGEIEPQSHENTKVLKPVLRFSEFEEAWQIKSLSSLLDVIDGDRGSNYPNSSEFSSEGHCLFLNAKNVTKTGFMFNERNFITKDKDNALRKGKLERGDIVLTTRGSVGFFAFYSSNINYDHLRINSGMVLLRNKTSDLLPLYFYKFTASKALADEIKKIAFGSAQPQLTVKEIKKFKIQVPLFQEQQKIADFLSSVDKKIEQLTEKHRLLTEYKKGVMQQLFTQQIRFKDNQGNDYPVWSLRGVGSVFEQRAERYQEGLELLSVTMNKGVKRRSEIDAKDSSSENKSNYKKVCIDDVVYNSMRMWQGASGVSSHEGVVSPAYTVLKGNESNVSSFFGYYFKTTKMIQIFQRNSQGLTSDTWNLKYKPLSKIKILVPVKEEQQTIANFLTEIDQKIDQVWSTLEQTKAFKKGLLQKMFV